MPITAFTDIVSLSIVMGIMVFVDALGYVTKVGLFYIAAGCLGLFATGWTFNNGAVIYMTAYDAATATFKTQSVDANLIVVTLAILTIVSFIFIFTERNLGGR